MQQTGKHCDCFVRLLTEAEPCIVVLSSTLKAEQQGKHMRPALATVCLQLRMDRTCMHMGILEYAVMRR